MAVTDYPFQISSPSWFPNNTVDAEALEYQIEQETSIVTALDHITVDQKAAPDDICNIWFADALSAAELAALEGIVAVHDGEPLPASDWAALVPEEPYVEFEYKKRKLVNERSYAKLSPDGTFSMLMRETTRTYKGSTEIEEVVTDYDPLGNVVGTPATYKWKTEKLPKNVEIRRRYKV